MKKEAVNTFSGGLNFDLNPITTPADVLTDAVNATFITFNGDELALQNDAGNTKILIEPESSKTVTTKSIKNGRLYNWYAAVDPRGLAPEGWHIPSRSELLEIAEYSSNNSGALSSLFEGNVFNNIIWSQTESIDNPEMTFAITAIYPPTNSIMIGTSTKHGSGAGAVRCIKNDSTYVSKLIDIDGNEYPTVKLGNQVWITKNLAVKHYKNGDLIGSNFNGTEGAVVVYGNDENNVYNTTTTVVTTPAKYVSLTDGFNPIGIKEFGGVLYIVSGKTPASTEWTTSGNYSIGTFVHDGSGVYYKSLINSNNDTLPTYTNTSWERMESWNTFANTYGQIEFGSYPSPQILTEESVGNGIPFTFNDPTKFSLFTSNVLNNYIFKAGEYAVFEGLNLDLINVTRYNYVNNIRTTPDLRIYNVKLYLQLTNGFIDLTTDVWNEYARFKGGTLNDQFWFNDPTFKYYCKSNFKGKLIMSVELEDLPLFKMNNYKVDQQDGVGYTITFNISFLNQTIWNITKLRVNYSLDDWVIKTSHEFTMFNGTADYMITVPFDKQGKTLKFIITPVFYNPGTTTEVTNELPEIYLNKYTASGSELLSTFFDYDSDDYDLEDYY